MAHHASPATNWPFEAGGVYTEYPAIGRGRSLVGRAPPLHGGGQEFESPRLHQHRSNQKELTDSEQGTSSKRLNASTDRGALLRNRPQWWPVLFCQFRWGPPPICRWPAAKPGHLDDEAFGPGNPGRTLKAEEREVLHQAVLMFRRGYSQAIHIGEP